MLVLRCTQKLLEKNPGPGTDHKDSLKPVLGDWHAKLIRLGHSPVVLCANDLSLLAILVRGKDFPRFVLSFRDRLASRLRRMGVSEQAITEELAAMEIVRIAKSNNRSVLGSMNDFVRHLRWKVDNDLDISQSDELENMLSEIPMGALKYQYPVEAAMATFNSSLISRKDLDTSNGLQ
jgi:hypothetical protein